MQVFKATVKQDGRSGLTLTTAVKVLKTSDSNARTELLREAAMMALFEHPNIVMLLGVVTIPRNMSVYSRLSLSCVLFSNVFGN